MSTYVMSDIHGHLDELNKMLNIIGFSDSDELILAGDYVDRGPKNLEMLRWISDCPDNVLLLQGNHDAEFAEYAIFMGLLCSKLDMDETDTEDTGTIYQALKLRQQYFDYYGTIDSLIKNHSVTIYDLKEWAAVINAMPYYFKRTVNGKKFIIVHAGYFEDEGASEEEKKNFFLYARREAFIRGGVPGTTIVAGHTPTVIMESPVYNNGKVFKYYDKHKDCTFYDIDCGCGYMGLRTDRKCRLACLRLDDEDVFYVE